MTVTRLLAVLTAAATLGSARAETLDPHGGVYDGTDNWNLLEVPFAALNVTDEDYVVFQYIKGQHFALVSNSSDCTGGESLPRIPCPKESQTGEVRYQCSIFNASWYNDEVPRWVYCNVTGHCEAGMNVKLTVEENYTSGEYEGGGGSGTNVTAQPLFFALHDEEGCNSTTVDAYVVSGVLTGMCNRLAANQSTMATCESISVFDDEDCQGEANTTALSDFCGGPSMRNATITCVDNATYVRIDIFDANDTSCSDLPVATQFAIEDKCMVSDTGQPFTMTDITNDTLILSTFPTWDCSGEANETVTVPLDTCLADNRTGRNYVFSWADPNNLTIDATGGASVAGGAKVAQLLAVFLLGVVVSFAA